MDQNAKQMIDGMRTGYDSLRGQFGDEETAELKAIIDQMTALAENNDFTTFVQEATNQGLFDRFNAKMSDLVEKAKELQKQAKPEQDPAKALENLKGTYQNMLRSFENNPDAVAQHDVAQRLVQLADKCSSASEFSKLAEEQGLFFALGQAGVIDQYAKVIKQDEAQGFKVALKYHSMILETARQSKSDVELQYGINKLIYPMNREDERHQYRLGRMLALINAIIEFEQMHEEEYRWSAEALYKQNIRFLDVDWEDIEKDKDLAHLVMKVRNDLTPEGYDALLSRCKEILFSKILKNAGA